METICPKCQASNSPDRIYCQACREVILGGLAHESLYDWLQIQMPLLPYGSYLLDDTLWIFIQPKVFYLEQQRLKNNMLVLGRQSESADHTCLPLNTPKLEDVGVSRFHAALIPLDSGVGLQDVGSTNGTRLNGQKLPQMRIYKLAHMDRVELGRLMTRIHFIPYDMYETLNQRFLIEELDLTVQKLIREIEIDPKAVRVMADRLKNHSQSQIQILSFLKEQATPVTIEKMNHYIDHLLGSDAPLSESSIDNTPDRFNEYQPTDRVPIIENSPPVISTTQRISFDPSDVANLQAPKSEKKPSPSKSRHALNELLDMAHQDALVFEERLQAYLEDAQHLTDHTQRQEAINVISSLLQQLNIWLPMADPNRAQNGS